MPLQFTQHIEGKKNPKNRQSCRAHWHWCKSQTTYHSPRTPNRASIHFRSCTNHILPHSVSLDIWLKQKLRSSDTADTVSHTSLERNSGENPLFNSAIRRRPSYMAFRKCLNPTHMCSLCLQRTSYLLGGVMGRGEPKPMFWENFTCNFTAQDLSCDICCQGFVGARKWLWVLLQCLSQMLRLLQRILTSVYFSLQQSVTAAISDSAKCGVFFLCVNEKKPFSSLVSLPSLCLVVLFCSLSWEKQGSVWLGNMWLMVTVSMRLLM